MAVDDDSELDRKRNELRVLLGIMIELEFASRKFSIYLGSIVATNCLINDFSTSVDSRKSRMSSLCSVRRCIASCCKVPV